MIELEFPDGRKKKFKEGVKGIEIASEISEGLGRAALAVCVGDKMLDVTAPISESGKFSIITFKDPEGVEVFRHSTAHLMAQAVTNLYPYAKLTIGPVVEEGFYYDIDHEPFTPEDLTKIEAEMKRLVKEKTEVVRSEVSKTEALEMFKDNEFKVEMIKELEEGQISVYSQGKFADLCRGPHVPNTGYIKSFKLTKIAGAYWRADAANKQLQRIYGISFPDKKDLKEWIHLREEAAKRDHRKLGRDLDLFSFHEEAPGMPFIHPKGMVIWNELVKFWQEQHTEHGYQEVKTPILLNRILWERSGHWENYRENMYTLKIDEMDYAVKPMNCPGGMLLYNEKIHSYKELPLRVGEIGLVHRHELSGTLSGLFRVRCFHQDDAHIFMTENQITSEVLGVLNLCEKFYSVFGLDFHLELSTRPEKSLGTDEQWDVATSGLRKALEETGRDFQINEGDGVFYGPKIDIHIKDALGRTWQCGTIQLDMQLPERFDLNYEGEDGKKHRPVTVHRVVYGSIERFFGVLVEHFAGKFPLWLSPVQVSVLTVADRHIEYAEKTVAKLMKKGIRCEVDSRAESIPKKVRDNQLKQINYILVVGDKEVEAGTVNVRTRDNVVHGERAVDDFLEQLEAEIESKKI